ncbi:MAG: c-type cytochrome [Thermoguttaceae bacterium]
MTKIRVLFVTCLFFAVIVGAVMAQTRVQRGRDVRQNAAVKTAEASASASNHSFPGVYDQWKNSRNIDWIAEEKARHEIKPPADNRSVLGAGRQGANNVYGNFTEADLKLWEVETEKMVVEGSLIFHNAGLLGSTIAVSCDMCHPDGEGTHPETYPKYQVQLGRAGLLRDMINWCLENPCRGTPMSGDDPRMRALEAYIQAQRTGKLMKYGKH